MKIAYLSTFYPFRGGIAQFNADLYTEFEKKHQIKAFTFSRQYPSILFPGSSQYVTETDKVKIIPSECTLDTLNPFSWYNTARKINSYAPDLMLMKFWMPYFAPSLGTVSSFLNKKTKIISVLDNVIPHERRPGDISMTKFFLNRNDGFVVMSDAVKNDMLKLKPDAKFIFHQHPLYDHFGAKMSKEEARKKLDIDSDKKVVLFFGFIRDYKGLDLLIKAFEPLSDAYVLLIAGEVYGDFTKYEDQIDTLNLRSKTRLHVRYINDDEVPVFFSAANVCVLPYKSATQSGITSISYHFNLPMIATDTGGLKESIHHNKNGIIVPEADAGLISKAITKYFDENLEKEFSKDIQNLKTELSWKHLSERIEEFYHSL